VDQHGASGGGSHRQDQSAALLARELDADALLLLIDVP
jgi:hypothetical protein